ncbi:MAG: cyclic nucleotide-binding domain-containing protein [Verrucomicrobiales bacterium]|nr:cyclic nucleotide-binding domain-containing protein [Verrucomicrobiales bacterium]
MPTDTNYNQLIPTFPLFHGFTSSGAEMVLERGKVRDVAAGTSLFREGDAAKSVLLVLKGTLEVFVTRDDRNLVLTRVEPGHIVGELAVLCGLPRSASVRAPDGAAVLEWVDDDFRRMLLGHAFLSQRILSEALRVLIEKERALIDRLLAQDAAKA